MADLERQASSIGREFRLAALKADQEVVPD
jgi:hypothetical protein